MDNTLRVWDSQSWRKERNERLAEWFKGNEYAVAVCVQLSTISETWDDLIDRDKPVTADTIHEAFTCAMVHLQTNPFFLQYHQQFISLIIVSINAWRDANELETSDRAEHRLLSFYIRNIAYEVATMCAFLVGGFDHLRKVSLEMRLFFQHESYLTWEKRI